MKLLSVGSIFFSGYLFLLFSGSPGFSNKSVSPPQDFDNDAINAIGISKIGFDNTQHKNEFGYNTGWIEFSNNSSQDIYLQADHWSISNNAENPGMYVIQKDLVIGPYQHIIVWCDKLNVIQKDLHTNFKLEYDKGFIGLYHIDAENTFKCVNALNYRNAGE